MKLFPLRHRFAVFNINTKCSPVIREIVPSQFIHCFVHIKFEARGGLLQDAMFVYQWEKWCIWLLWRFWFSETLNSFVLEFFERIRSEGPLACIISSAIYLILASFFSRNISISHRLSCNDFHFVCVTMEIIHGNSNYSLRWCSIYYSEKNVILNWLVIAARLNLTIKKRWWSFFFAIFRRYSSILFEKIRIGEKDQNSFPMKITANTMKFQRNAFIATLIVGPLNAIQKETSQTTDQLETSFFLQTLHSRRFNITFFCPISLNSHLNVMRGTNVSHICKQRHEIRSSMAKAV